MDWNNGHIGRIQIAWEDAAGITPAQHELRAPSLDRPLPRLMQAVLARAVRDYLDQASGRKRGSCASLAAWFASPQGDWPLSFEAICEALDLDCTAVREGLARRASEVAEPGARDASPALRFVQRRPAGSGRSRCASRASSHHRVVARRTLHVDALAVGRTIATEEVP